MSRTTFRLVVAGLLLAVTVPLPAHAAGGGYTLVGWNDLGMHCVDADFAEFSILPPYNTIHAQLLDPSGQPVASPGDFVVTYEAMADPAGSINTTSVGKTDFWGHVAALFGVSLAPDEGLAGFDMPGGANTPRVMAYEPAFAWFTAEGIPLTNYDDAGHTNYYPMMRLVARDGSGSVVATTEIVLPISDEMTCTACHASGSGPAAEPTGGWVNDPDPERDYRLNILLLHDQMQEGQPAWAAALAAAGYDASGLYATSTGGTSVLCAKCHGSNALPGTGMEGISQLTRAVHSLHAGVTDPVTGMSLDSSENRTACYRCHPGSDTRCLRGAMGNAAAADGTLAIQCQSCHGGMSAVGDAARRGWFDEPVCQSCHTGTATHNNGQIRYSTVFEPDGTVRTAVDQTFATEPDEPMAGVSLYRFSAGHGGLKCEACHGSTHAIFPSREANDNRQSELLQGHAGTLVECGTCHATVPATVNGGPHGMHPVGQAWVVAHQSAADSNRSQCRACHGADYRGTVLSRVQADRTLTAFGTRTFWRGFQVGCYTCHNGPDSESGTSNSPAVVGDVAASTTAGTPVTIPLAASDPNGDQLTLRVVGQPAHGSAGIAGTTATYRPDPGFTGSDTFTFAAWDGATDSNLGHVTVQVSAGTTALIFASGFESSGTAGWSVTVP